VKPLWLVGENIARSPSPAMHNAALSELGHDELYSLRPTKPAELDDVLDEAERTTRGINVTAPHKVRVATRYAKFLDDDARAAGAVNTVVYGDDGAIRALNTDVAGLLFAWDRSNLHVEGHDIALVGSGGAARAVLVAAAQAGAHGVTIRARHGLDEMRTLARSLGLGDAAQNASPSLAVFAVSALDDAAAAIEAVLPTRSAVHDLRYGVAAHQTRNAALRAGHLFVDGSLMLLAQAQLASAAFFGSPLNERAAGAMRRALVESLRE
jgi:shikimate dehydrogenase